MSVHTSAIVPGSQAQRRREELEALRLHTQLIPLCISLGLPANGNKAQVVDAIVKHEMHLRMLAVGGGPGGEAGAYIGGRCALGGWWVRARVHAAARTGDLDLAVEPAARAGRPEEETEGEAGALAGAAEQEAGNMSVPFHALEAAVTVEGDGSSGGSGSNGTSGRGCSAASWRPPRWASFPAMVIEAVAQEQRAAGAAPHLRSLWLTNHRVSALPDAAYWGAHLPGLHTLGLAHNGLLSLPAGLDAALPQLRRLDLRGNALRRLPAGALRDMAQLQELWLDDNRVTEAPAWLGRLPALERLGLSGNALDSVPASLGRLPRLAELHLDRNRLESLPDELALLRASLRVLGLAYNRFRALPACVQRLRPRLAVLRFEGNFSMPDVDLQSLPVRACKPAPARHAGLTLFARVPQRRADGYLATRLTHSEAGEEAWAPGYAAESVGSNAATGRWLRGGADGVGGENVARQVLRARARARARARGGQGVAAK